MTKQAVSAASLAFTTIAAAAAYGPPGHFPPHYPPFQSNGCGKHYPAGFNNDTATHSLISGGIDRTFAVNVPNGYNVSPYKRWPLIIDYHGSGGTAWTQYNNSLYFTYPEGQEYLVVYPNGLNGSWQGPTYATPGVSDIDFTDDLLKLITSEYCIDSSRVYASGKSNGAGFVDTLACSDVGDNFAAFAMASAALYTDTSEDSCTKKRAILESHGDEDSTIPYYPTKPGRGGPLPNITEWVSWWGYRTCGPHAKPQNTVDLGGYNTTSYSCWIWNNVIEHYQVFELGHCWPNSLSDNYDALVPGQDTRKCLDRVLDYTPVVLDFFSRWNIYNAPKN